MARIALVCEPPDGGVAEHVAQLARGLARARARAGPVRARGVRARGRLRAAAVPARLRAPAPTTRARSARLVRELRGFDLVHAHSAKAGVLARLAAGLRALPVVYTPHGFPFVGEMREARRVLLARRSSGRSRRRPPR